MSELAPSEKMMMPTPMPAGNSESPVLMLTDIGRDIDDTVALIALANYQREGLLRLVGVVATGGVGKHRAVLARDWLRKLGYEDKDVVLAACPHAGEETCFHIRVPPGSVEQANLFEGGREGHEADMIRSLATKHAGKLQIFATAPLSSLAKAIESEEGLGIVKRGLKTLHIQGQATVNANGLLEPDFRAFNLREDEPAAIDVFKKLQQDVPFRLLGKNAAYRVSLTLEDFKGWDVAHGGEDCDILRRNVKLGLAGLKQRLPDVFDRLYPVPKEKRDTEGWFDCIDVVSHPYDPLLVVSAYHPHLFQAAMQERTGRESHQLIGMEEEQPCGVPDETLAHKELKRTVLAGMQASSLST